MNIGILANDDVHLDFFYPPIVAGLTEQGFAVSCASGTVTRKVESTVLSGVTRRPSLRNVKAPGQLSAWARDHDLDVIVTNTATPSALARIARGLPPVVYFAHGLHWQDPQDRRDAAWKLAERLLLARTSAAICINDEDEFWFTKHAPDMPLIRLPFGIGVETDRFPRTTNTTAPVLKLVWIGEFSKRKNPLNAIDMMEQLRSLGVRAEMRMLGEGPLHDACRDRVQAAGLAGIEFPGKVDPNPHLIWSNALVHTSSWEGLPRVVLEALSVGRPVFAYDVKGVRRLPEVRTTPWARPERLAAEIARWSSSLDETPSADAFPSHDELDARHPPRLIGEFLTRLAGEGAW